MKKYEVKDHAPSYLPEGEWKLVWADEFDGNKLDKSKWGFRKHLFHKRHECWIEDEGLEFKDSNIIFKKVERNGKLYSCQLQTGENWYDRPGVSEYWNVAKFNEPTFLHKFGYYEVCCKLQRGDDWWSAFWLQSPTIGTHPDEKRAGVEVDIFEAFFGNSYMPHYIHWGGYAEDHKFDSHLDRYATFEDAIPLDEGYHRFGCLWDEEGYTFYVDGIQIGEKLTKGVSHTETFILLGTEIVGARGFIPGIYKDVENIKSVKDDKFIVDYVRVFDKVI